MGKDYVIHKVISNSFPYVTMIVCSLPNIGCQVNEVREINEDICFTLNYRYLQVKYIETIERNEMRKLVLKWELLAKKIDVNKENYKAMHFYTLIVCIYSYFFFLNKIVLQIHGHSCLFTGKT